jgi:hypothetical protein
MTGLAIAAFRGAVPRMSERLIDSNQAQQALNCKITSGRLDPLKGLGLVHTSVAAAITTMYRYRFGDVYNWLVWANEVVDVAKSPVAQDTLGRFYFTGDGEPRMSTYADAINASLYPDAWFVLGVVSPVTAMAITVIGGVGANEDRAYVYTFRTRYGEESGPSPATLKTGKVDGSWDITLMDAAPPNTGTISAAVKDTPIIGQVEVTLDTVFGLAAGEEVTFADVVDMTDLNGTFELVSVDVGTNKVVVNLATTQTYSAGADTWARVAPHNTASMTKCIYRTVGTNTDYRLVAEIPAANTTYSDTVSAVTVSLNAGIATLDTLPPPKNMHSIVLLANGVMAGLSGSELCLSEQGKPYSWPISNRYSFPGTGIALVAAGNAVIVLTDSYPLVATATVPEAATLTKIPGDTLAPCVAKRGVVDIGSGGLFPSHDGLYVATTGGVRNITEALFTFDEWQLLIPETFKAGFHAGAYYAMHDTADQPSMFMMHTKESDSVLEFNEQVDVVYQNPWDGRLYVGKGPDIYQWDSNDIKRYTSSWQSKDFQLAKSVNLSVAQVQARWSDFAAYDTSIQDANEALLADVRNVNGEIGCFEVGVYEIGASAILPVPEQTAPSVQFTLIRDGDPVFTKQVTDSTPFRLPGDEKSDLYAVQISTTIPVYSINAAQGMNELKQAPV